MICVVWAAIIILIWSFYSAQILGFWVTCGVKIMSLCHDWGLQPPKTAFHIHFRLIQSVWAHWYAVHGDTVSALHSCTHPTWLRFWFWGSGSLVESKWCHYVMIEADSHLKLLHASIFKHAKCLSMLVCCPLACSSSLKQFYPPYLA
jgi:hypothetical protein